VPLNEYQFPPSKIANIQSQLEKLIANNHYLNDAAKQAYRSYLQSYNAHSLKNIFDINALDLKGVCKAFGFAVPIHCNLGTFSFTLSLFCFHISPFVCSCG
jgi:ATP-dependent RNA helicase DDX18/HAS1